MNTSNLFAYGNGQEAERSVRTPGSRACLTWNQRRARFYHRSARHKCKESYHESQPRW